MSNCICCVCNTSACVIHITDCISDNIPWILKLKSVIPNIEWNDSWMLCSQCCDNLNFAHNFWLTCINSDIARTKTSELQKSSAWCYDKVKDEFATNKYDIKTEMDISETEIDNNLVLLCEPKLDLTETNLQEELTENKSDVSMDNLGNLESKQFQLKHNEVHMKNHRAEGNTYKCTYCDKTFESKRYLAVHIKRHLNNREYKCEICQKRYNTKNNLNNHKLLVHTDKKEWKFVCTYCNKQFPMKLRFDEHLRSHTGDKPFECHICDKRFNQKSNLNQHVLTHSNSNSFKCEQCDKEYTTKRILNRHITKVHGLEKDKKYHCDMCTKSFFENCDLTKHMVSHIGEDCPLCHICSKKFKYRYNLNRHLKNVHNILEKEDN